MSVTARPGPMMTVSIGTFRSSATLTAAVAHASPAIPVISVNLVYGARSRVETRLAASPTQTCGSGEPGTVDGWWYSSGSRVGSGRVEPSGTMAVDS